MKKTGLFLAPMFLAFFLSCGIKGPPLPPEEENESVQKNKLFESRTSSTLTASSTTTASATQKVRVKK